MERGGKTGNRFKERMGVTLPNAGGAKEIFFISMLQWLLVLSAEPAFNMKSCGIENRQLIKVEVTVGFLMDQVNAIPAHKCLKTHTVTHFSCHSRIQ